MDGRGWGVGRGLGVGSHLPMHGVGVGVGLAVGVTLGVGVGSGPWTQYLPPVFVGGKASIPPQMTISLPVQTAV
jgi:hypothetical protein